MISFVGYLVQRKEPLYRLRKKGAGGGAHRGDEPSECPFMDIKVKGHISYAGMGLMMGNRRALSGPYTGLQRRLGFRHH